MLCRSDGDEMMSMDEQLSASSQVAGMQPSCCSRSSAQKDCVLVLLSLWHGEYAVSLLLVGRSRSPVRGPLGSNCHLYLVLHVGPDLEIGCHVPAHFHHGHCRVNRRSAQMGWSLVLLHVGEKRAPTPWVCRCATKLGPRSSPAYLRPWRVCSGMHPCLM